MEEWKEYKLGDVCIELSDGLHKAPKFINGGDYIFVNAKNIKDGFIVDNDPTKKSSYEEYVKYSSPLNETSILYSIDGTIGNVALYRGEKCILGKGACYLNPNPLKLDKMYLYYELQSPYFKSYIDKMSTGSTIKHISLKTMRNYEMMLPSIAEQRRIASILSSLDDKIEVNRRINENLEAQAQALFKSWFVDFEPFRDGEFVESELGRIPKGWRVGTLSEVAFINPQRNLKKGTNATYLDMKNMPTTGSFPSKWEYKDFNGGMKFQNRDTIMARITPCLENGKVAYVNFLKENEVAFGSTEYIVMTTKDGFMPEILYFLCRDEAFKGYATKNMNGSSGRQRVSGETIGNYKIVIPPKSQVEQLALYYKGIMDLVRKNGLESRRLATLRDTLLPRLMSGELKVNEIAYE